MFKKQKVCLIKNALPTYMVNFLNKYFKIKEAAATKLYEDRYIPEVAHEWGTHMDGQVNGSYSIYGDQAADTLLITLQPIFEKAIKESKEAVESVKIVEPARARNEEGKFIADDKSTEDVNEAWVGGVAPKKKSPKVIKKKSR